MARSNPPQCVTSQSRQKSPQSDHVYIVGALAFDDDWADILIKAKRIHSPTVIAPCADLRCEKTHPKEGFEVSLYHRLERFIERNESTIDL